MKRKWKIIMGVALAAVVLVIVSLQYTQGVEAKLLKVEPRTIAQTFKEEGIVTAEKEYPFYASFSSKIISLPIKEGQVVEQGELLAEFDTRELQYQLAQIQGQIKSIQAEQELQKSVISLDKMRELYEAGAISQKEYEDAGIK